MEPEEPTVPGTRVVPWLKEKLVVVTVVESIASLNTAESPVLRNTLVAASAGTVELTVGARAATGGEPVPGVEFPAGLAHPPKEKIASTNAGTKYKRIRIAVPPFSFKVWCLSWEGKGTDWGSLIFERFLKIQMKKEQYSKSSRKKIEKSTSKSKFWRY